METLHTWDMVYVPQHEMLVRLLAAATLAGLVGLERELGGKTMGLRTMILVATGAALMTLLAMDLAAVAARDLEMKLDPGRIIQGIVSGIGLLGVGALLQSQRRLRGATTGASVWLVGGVGIACGLGLYVAAAAATAIGLFVLAGLGLLERWIKKKLSDD